MCRRAEQLIESTIERLFGEMSGVLYWHLENVFGVNKHDIALNPAMFVASLRSLFGPKSAEILEKNICKELSEELGEAFKEENSLERVLKRITEQACDEK